MKKTMLAFRPFWRVLLAIATVTIYSILLTSLRQYFTISIVALLYLVPVVISAAFWGGLAGIAASILSFLIFNFYFLHPLYTFEVSQPQDILVMFVLLGVAMLVSNLMARAQQRLKQVQAREREVLQLYELSAALTGQTDAQRVTHILAQRLAGLFPDTSVEIQVNTSGRNFTVCEPEEFIQPACTPILYASPFMHPKD